MNIAQVIPFADAWMHGGWGWAWMTLMMILMVLFWAAVIFGVVWLIRSAVDRPGPRTESPIEVLERRFAEGAISVEDYQARREVLVNGGTGSNASRERDPNAAQRASQG